MDYLNGKKSINGYAARNTTQKLHTRQGLVDRTQDEDKLNATRDKISTLGSLNKMALFMIMLINKLAEARILVIFVSYGPGTLNSITRRDSCLFNRLPPSIFNKDVEAFHPFQKVFGLDAVKSRIQHPCYMDFMADESALTFLTFTKLQGNVAVKRPSKVYGLDSEIEKFTKAEQERYMCFSEMVDVNSSWGDLLVITNDKEVPAQNYLFSMEGSGHMVSHFNHIGNLVHHVFDRDTFDKVTNFTYIYWRIMSHFCI